MQAKHLALKSLLHQIRNCETCIEHLPLGPRPVVSAHAKSRILIIGQAPGTKVHASGIPWDDASGERLREWMDISTEDFYDPEVCAIVPMGFCYPGKGKSGDLPPRPECAPQWHEALLEKMPNIKLTLLIGSYAQKEYLGKRTHSTLTETVRNFNDFLPNYFTLPHPSPRNNIWMAKNQWFAEEVLPELRNLVLSSH